MFHSLFVVCCVLFERGVIFCVLCLIVVPLPPGKTPFAVQLNHKIIIIIIIIIIIPPLWSSGQFPALPDFLRSSGSGTGSTQPREYN
jgi:hypothetical protein